MKQLAVSTRTYASAGSQVVETTKNTYSYDGIRVSSVSASTVNGVLRSSATSFFLIDPLSLTGFAQVIEELSAIGAAPTVSYTLGNDIIAQSSNPSGSAQYLLKDGQDSTRQLATSLGAVTDYYGYDAYGVMLGGNPTSSNPSATKMLYSGEQFDANLGLYNQRARFYDPGTGRFTTMDSYEGSPQDPQSLHKNAYCTDNPVNYHDPSGHQSLAEVVTVVAITGILIGIGLGALNKWRGGSFSPDSCLFGVSLSVSGQGAGAAAVYVANLISSAAGGAGTNGGTLATDIVGLAGGSFAPFAGNFGVGASFNAGLESLYTTGDNAISSWTYFGPGFGQSASFTSLLAATVTFYAGVCWGAPTYDTYSGGFISLSMGAGSAVFGFAFNFFWSDSNPAQNGYSVGLTVSVPPGGPGSNLGSGIGLSYVDYKGGYAGPWSQASYVLVVLALAPGMQLRVPFLGYKWANKIG